MVSEGGPGSLDSWVLFLVLLECGVVQPVLGGCSPFWGHGASPLAGAVPGRVGLDISLWGSDP